MIFKTQILSFVLLILFSVCFADEKSDKPPTVATFSIVAVDRTTGEIGVAVQSKIVGVGAIVPYAKAGVGAVATQAYANVTFGPRGLDLLRKGAAPHEVLEELLAQDTDREHRQIGIISAEGTVANFTGEKCQDWAGAIPGEEFSVQGNILVSEEVLSAMAKAFTETEGLLAERLIATLKAGQTAGGDRRGRQSAALLVVREGWGYGGLNDRFRDIRVDEHEEPIKELERVYLAHRKLFPRPNTNIPKPLVE